MIQNFKRIGEILLKKDGFYEAADEIEKRKILLNHQTLKPYIKKDKNKKIILDGKAICLNFDLDKDFFEFKLSDMDLDERNKEHFFAFRLGAPKDKKKFFSTNSLDTFYSALFTQSMDYITSKRNKAKSRQWFKTNIKETYETLLQIILEKFYIKEGQEFLLDYTKLGSHQKQVFEQVKNDQSDVTKTNELYIRFLNKHFFNSESKSTAYFPGICVVLINNQQIMDFNDSEFQKDYINLCFYDLLERFFVEDSKAKKNCHICNVDSDVIQNIPFSMKFYGTTNNLNFENVTKNNAFKSFAICKKCFQETLTGMKHIEQYFSEYLFDMSYYLIPHADKNLPFHIFKRINTIFKRQRQKYSDEINQIKSALETANQKTARFDLFFFFSPAGSQQFDVLQYISNIDMQNFLAKLEKFDAVSEIYWLDRIGQFDNSLTIQDLRFYLFPSINTHTSQPDPKTFRKDLLYFLTCFLGDRPLNYNDLIARFVSIYKKRLNHEKIDNLSAFNLSAFKMNLFLSIMLKLKKIKGGNSVKTGESISSILKKEYEQFFETHHEIYFENAFRQGLFLLGTIISKIKFQQKGKKATFLKKLNFSGIPPRRLPSLIGQVKDFSQIYKVYEEPGIWGNLMDRLQGIQTSGMKPDEILFYILSGISFEDYLGIKFGYEKKLENNSKEQGEDNDN